MTGWKESRKKEQMIEKFKFECLMADLAMFFTPPNEDALIKYYEIFKDEDENSLKIAVKTLIETHEFKRFPLPKEIIEAMTYSSKINGSINNLPGCEKCNMTGFQLEDHLTLGVIRKTAVPCNCEKGKKFKRGLKSPKAVARRKMLYRG